MNALEQARWMDRYLEGELSGIELQQFMERLEQDAEFRSRVSLRNLMIEGIRQAADEDLLMKIEAGIRYRRPKVPVGLKLLMTFLLVTGLGIFLWNYTGVNSDADRPFLRLGWLKQRKSEKPPVTSANRAVKVVAPLPEENPQPGEEASGMLSPAAVDTSADALSKDSIVDAAGEIVVRKDQMLIALDLPVQDPDRKPASESMENRTVERLNPAAGLVKSDEAERTVSTEFWISPVNYKGYRLHDGKLVLYGIEAPDRVSLHRNGDRLLLHYENEMYVLTESDEFQPYPRAQEAARTENR